MDTLIRALQVSEQSIPLGLRRRPVPPPGMDVPGRQVPGPRPVEPAGLVDVRESRGNGEEKADAGRIEIEREKIRAELARELDARAESVLQEARGRGLQEGLELGRAEALREAERQHEAVAQTLAIVADRVEREIAGAEDAIVGMAFESVCRILARDVVDRKAIRAMVRQVLARVGQEEGVAVRLHPQDCAALRNGGKALLPGRNGRMKVELVADEAVSLGGCVVETTGGSLDARIETQIQRLRETLLKVRHGGTKKSRAKS
jgi:flagellar assembly protein FliH